MTDLVEATLQQQSKDQEVVSSLGMKKHQEEFLAHVQAGIRRIFGLMMIFIYNRCFDVFLFFVDVFGENDPLQKKRDDLDSSVDPGLDSQQPKRGNMSQSVQL